MGSIFVPTYECDASEEFKQIYLQSSRSDLMIIQSPVGMPGRAFTSDFLVNMNKGNERPIACPYKCIKTCDYKKSPYCIMKALYNASRGRMNKGYAFAGANAYLSDKLRSVKEVIFRLKEEYNATQSTGILQDMQE